MRSIRIVLLVLGLVAAGVVLAPSAVAIGAQTPTTAPQTSTTLPESTAIDPNVAFTGATITSPADPAPRSLNSYQTAVFMQSWLGEAVFGTPKFQDPPADLPVYRVEVSQLMRDSQPPIAKYSVYFASDGTTGFISYPRGQDPTAPPAEPPPAAPGTWWIAPQRTIDAFNGKGTLVNTGGVQQANSPRTPVTPESTSTSSTSWVVYALVIGAAVVLIGGGVMFFRRRRSTDRLAAAD